MLLDALGIAFVVLLVAFSILAIWLNYVRHQTAARSARATSNETKTRRVDKEVAQGTPAQLTRYSARLTRSEIRNPEAH